MYFKIILFVCLPILANAHDELEQRISGGEKAKVGQFPYQVSLEVKLVTFWHSVCSGALIKPNYVLTGAECVFALKMRVRAGFVSRSSPNEKYLDVTLRTKHPNYNPETFANDIAILKLKDSFPISNTIRVVKLPTANSAPTGRGVLAGWGVVKSGADETPSPDLYYATFTIISNQVCKSALGSKPPHQLLQSNVCARSPSALACSGDEGSSLVQNNVAIGVKSWIESSCDKNNNPAVFTKVSAYIAWINSVINK